MSLHLLHPSEDNRRTSSSLADIVAVHGLDEDKISAWTDLETGCLWLRDLLPFGVLPVDVLTFGYKADATAFLGSSSSDRTLQYAQTLVAELQAERDLVGTQERPIIFVCHGLGGVLVKQALAYSSTRTSPGVRHLRSIFISTCAILFMGTPHNGIDKTKWPLMARDVEGVLQAPSQFLTSLNRNSETLQNITDQFAPLTKQFHIYFFWECMETEKGQIKGYVVDEASAAPIWDNTERSGIEATHAQMCKFRDVNSPGYKNVYASLRRYAMRAPYIIGPRWEKEKALEEQASKEEAHPVAFDAHRQNQLFHYKQPKPARVQNKYFFVPRGTSSIFTGREKISRGLKEKILAPSSTKAPSQQRRFVVYGLGGSGKSQFCLKFAQDVQDKFWGVFWIDASTTQNAERAFSELGRLGNMEDKFESGMYWLAGLGLPWLLVIDNADDLGFDYSKYFPPGERGHILVTSRNPECRIHATIGYYEFKELEPDDAITLLLKAADEKELGDPERRALAAPVAKELGYLPLALIQAGASIRQGRCPIEEYVDVFAAQKRAILENGLGRGANDNEFSIYTTWEVSFQKIEAQHTEAAMDAVQILHILAFLHFERVPVALFQEAWKNMRRAGSPEQPASWLKTYASPIFALLTSIYEKLVSRGVVQLPDILVQSDSRWDQGRLHRALLLLSSYSLIFQDVSRDSLSMHPMVHFWARARLQPNDRQVWFEIAQRVVADSINDQAGISNTIYRRSLIPHIDACLHGEFADSGPSQHIETVHLVGYIKFADVYSEGGRWKEAKELQQRILDTQRSLLGSDHPKTLEGMASMAWSCWNLSQMGEALELQTKVLGASVRRLGSQDPLTLRAMDSLGRTCWLCGDIARAEELGRQAVEGMIAVLGEGDPHTLGAIHNHARACMHRGRTREAQQMQLKVLGARARMLGAEHLDTLETMADLGMSCLALGQVNEAEKFVANVLEQRKRSLGQEHAYTLWSMNDLAKIYCAQGFAKEAEVMLVQTRKIAARTLGEDHIGMLMTMRNLAHAYSCQQRWADTESLLKTLIEVESRKLPSSHPDILVTKAELGEVYRQQGRDERAEMVLLHVLQVMKKTMDPAHPRKLSVTGQLAAMYRDAGRVEEAEALEEGGTLQKDGRKTVARKEPGKVVTFPRRVSTA